MTHFSESCNCMHYISYWDGKNDIVFLGDSRIRQLYFAFVNMLSHETIPSAKKHSDIQYTDKKLKLKVVGTIQLQSGYSYCLFGKHPLNSWSKEQASKRCNCSNCPGLQSFVYTGSVGQFD